MRPLKNVKQYNENLKLFLKTKNTDASEESKQYTGELTN